MKMPDFEFHVKCHGLASLDQEAAPIQCITNAFEHGCPVSLKQVSVYVNEPFEKEASR
jgi:hypothetical protein